MILLYSCIFAIFCIFRNRDPEYEKKSKIDIENPNENENDFTRQFSNDYRMTGSGLILL